jgi:hypothetical protein
MSHGFEPYRKPTEEELAAKVALVSEDVDRYFLTMCDFVACLLTRESALKVNKLLNTAKDTVLKLYREEAQWD